MQGFKYENFELVISRGAGGLQVRVHDSPAGAVTAAWEDTFTEEQLNAWLSKLGPQRSTRRSNSAQVRAARELGTALFRAVFTHEVRACFRSSLAIAKARSGRLRLKLTLSNDSLLAAIPWEFLFDPETEQFLTQSVQTPIVRSVDLPSTIHPLSVSFPLRVLGIVSRPTDRGHIDADKEKRLLEETLAERNPNVQLEWLTAPNLRALRERLRDWGRPIHILHFIGHGEYSEEAAEGVLTFERPGGKADDIGASALATTLRDHTSLRLVVLNCCEGATHSRTEFFGSVATTLLRQDLPAVVAMQFEISDEAAIAFAREFYAALSAGYPLEAAVAEARKALLELPDSTEWGTPVLYSRVFDEPLFHVPSVAAAPITMANSTALHGASEWSRIQAWWSACETEIKALRQMWLQRAFKLRQRQHLITLLFASFGLSWILLPFAYAGNSTVGFLWLLSGVLLGGLSAIERYGYGVVLGWIIVPLLLLELPIVQQALSVLTSILPSNMNARFFYGSMAYSVFVAAAISPFRVPQPVVAAPHERAVNPRKRVIFRMLCVLPPLVWAVFFSVGQAPDTSESSLQADQEAVDAVPAEIEALQDKALAGDQNAQMRLARGYEDGAGYEQSEQEALKWYRMAAEGGEPLAQFKLGDAFYRGIGGLDQSNAEALKWLKLAAKQSNADAENLLGEMYENGYGVDVDPVLAREHYERATNQGHLRAMAHLGHMHRNANGGLEENIIEAVRLYSLAAEGNDAWAQFYLGDLYESGAPGVPMDLEKAITFYQEAAEQSDPDAQYAMGRLYQDGGGSLKQNKEKAREFYELAAEQGHAEAMNALGYFHQYGLGGLALSWETALKWYTAAAEGGSAKGQHNLSFMYRHGIGGVKADAVQAFEWEKKAAEAGFTNAQVELAGMYQEGYGTDKSSKAAAQWLFKAAQQGHSDAQNKYGLTLYNGTGVEKDAAEAVKWFEKAAQQGHAVAQANLAKMYEFGRGVPPSDVHALRWYFEAAKQGHAGANYAVGQFYRLGRGGLHKDLDEAIKRYTVAANADHADAKKALSELKQ